VLDPHHPFAAGRLSKLASEFGGQALDVFLMFHLKVHRDLIRPFIMVILLANSLV
jgi:hypothetical protein